MEIKTWKMYISLGKQKRDHKERAAYPQLKDLAAKTIEGQLPDLDPVL